MTFFYTKQTFNSFSNSQTPKMFFSAFIHCFWYLRKNNIFHGNKTEFENDDYDDVEKNAFMWKFCENFENFENETAIEKISQDM